MYNTTHIQASIQALAHTGQLTPTKSTTISLSQTSGPQPNIWLRTSIQGVRSRANLPYGTPEKLNAQTQSAAENQKREGEDDMQKNEQGSNLQAAP